MDSVVDLLGVLGFAISTIVAMAAFLWWVREPTIEVLGGHIDVDIPERGSEKAETGRILGDGVVKLFFAGGGRDRRLVEWLWSVSIQGVGLRPGDMQSLDIVIPKHATVVAELPLQRIGLHVRDETKEVLVGIQVRLDRYWDGVTTRMFQEGKRRYVVDPIGVRRALFAEFRRPPVWRRIVIQIARRFD